MLTAKKPTVSENREVGRSEDACMRVMMLSSLS